MFMVLFLFSIFYVAYHFPNWLLWLDLEPCIQFDCKYLKNDDKQSLPIPYGSILRSKGIVLVVYS